MSVLNNRYVCIHVASEYYEEHPQFIYAKDEEEAAETYARDNECYKEIYVIKLESAPKYIVEKVSSCIVRKVQ